MKKIFFSLLIVLFSLPVGLASNANAADYSVVAACDLSDNRIQVFAVDANGHIFSRWKTNLDPNCGWTAWSAFQTPAQGATSISAANLTDKRPQLFATDRLGHIWSCWKSGAASDSNWTPWSSFD